MKNILYMALTIGLLGGMCAFFVETVPFGKTTSEPVTVSVTGDNFCKIDFINNEGKIVATYSGACHLWRDKKTATFKTWKGLLSGETRSGIYNIE